MTSPQRASRPSDVDDDVPPTPGPVLPRIPEHEVPELAESELPEVGSDDVLATPPPRLPEVDDTDAGVDEGSR